MPAAGHGGEVQAGVLVLEEVGAQAFELKTELLPELPALPLHRSFHPVLTGALFVVVPL